MDRTTCPLFPLVIFSCQMWPLHLDGERSHIVMNGAQPLCINKALGEPESQHTTVGYQVLAGQIPALGEACLMLMFLQ